MSTTALQDRIDHARESADIGIARSSDAEGEIWFNDARDFLKRYLETHETMHTDELWSHGLPKANQRRALGAVMRSAQSLNWMEQIIVNKEKGWIASLPSVTSNRTLKAVWRSNIYTASSEDDYWRELGL